MSSAAVVGTYGVNTMPPSNYTMYYAYIRALATEVAATFGGAERIQQWRWGVFTEFNNPEWFVNEPNAFLSIYDTTVRALQDALGKENLFV